MKIFTETPLSSPHLPGDEVPHNADEHLLVITGHRWENWTDGVTWLMASPAHRIRRGDAVRARYGTPT